MINHSVKEVWTLSNYRYSLPEELPYSSRTRLFI